MPVDLQLHGAANTPLLPSKLVEMEFQIGPHTFTESLFVIENLQAELLLGLPSMMKHKLDIINSKGCVAVPSDHGHTLIPFQLHDSQTDNSTARCSYPVHLAENIWLPAGTSSLVSVRIGKFQRTKTNKTVIFTPVETYSNAVAAHGVGHVLKQSSTISLANLGTIGATLKKGTLVAVCQIIDDRSFPMLPLDDAVEITHRRHIALIHQDVLQINSSDKPDLNTLYKKYNVPNDIFIGEKDLTPNQIHQLLALLGTFKDVFATDNDNPGMVSPSVAAHDIDLIDGATPHYSPPRRVSPAQREEIKKQLDRLLAAKIIQPSRSPWGSNVLLVPKPVPGEFRMAIDFRNLNTKTKREIYALPRCDDIFDALSGKFFFTTLDAANGFFQIPLTQRSKQLTAFTTFSGSFQYNSMPFGLVNAPSTYQRMMDSILATDQLAEWKHENASGRERRSSIPCTNMKMHPRSTWWQIMF